VLIFNVPFLIVNPLINLGFLVAALLLFVIARIPRSYVIKFVPFVCTLTFFLFLSFAFFPSVWLHPPYKYVFFHWGAFTYYYENFIASVTMWCRWMAAVFGVLFVFSIIDERDINIALKSLRFPYYIRLTIATALRCFFTFYYDALQIIEAQKARGLDLDSVGLFKKVKYYSAVMVPLIMVELKKADEMSDAADSRGYVATFKKSSYQRTEYVGHDSTFKVPDFLLIGFSLVLLVGVIIARYIPGIGDFIKFIPANPSYWASIF
jgi:energy-coupling factor transporter transmembrane protein EcfT